MEKSKKFVLPKAFTDRAFIEKNPGAQKIKAGLDTYDLKRQGQQRDPAIGKIFEGLTEGEFSVISKTEDPREDRDYPCAYCKAEVRVSTLVPVSNGKGQPNAAWVCPGCQDTAQAMVDANRQAYLSADSEPEESAPQDHSG